MVEARPFQGRGMGSIPIRNTISPKYKGSKILSHLRCHLGPDRNAGVVLRTFLRIIFKRVSRKKCSTIGLPCSKAGDGALQALWEISIISRSTKGLVVWPADI